MISEQSPGSPNLADGRTEVTAENAATYGLTATLFLDNLAVYQARTLVSPDPVPGRFRFACVVPVSRADCLPRIRQILGSNFRLLEQRQVETDIEISLQLS